MIDILKEAGETSQIGILGHIRPDGDCVGSCLALYNYLKNAFDGRGKDISLFLDEPNNIYSYLKGFDEIETSFDRKRLDLCFVLDVSSCDRLGDGDELFKNADKTICIDHHISNKGFADLNQIEPDSSSTAEVLFTLFDEKYIDTEIAKAVFTGIVHDSGVFQYSCMGRRSFEIVARLCDYDFDRSRIIDESFYQKTYSQNQILGRTLLESILFMDGKCIAGFVTRKTMDFYKIEPKDLDGIVNQLRVTKGVEVAIFLYEIHPLQYKVSLRSNNKINVEKIATVFGGGGHLRASGCTMNGTVYDVINNLSLQIEKQFDQNERDNNSK